MNPRGRIQHTNRPVRVGTCEVLGLKPRIVAYVKTGSRRLRDDFFKACRHLGLDAQEVQAFGDWITVYDVCGTAEALAEFTERKCVERWHYALDSRLPYRGMGAGEKVKRRPHPMDARLDAVRERQDMRDAVGL